MVVVNMEFKSSTELEQNRQQLREARQIYLNKAREDYEREERRKEKAKSRGEDTWMLSSVTQRLNNEKQSVEKSKKKKKEKKKKKRKKKKDSSSSDSDSDSDNDSSKKKREKKKRKKKKQSSSSSSGSASDDGPQWVEKVEDKGPAAATGVKGPKLERDSWMCAPPELFPTVTRKDLIDKKNKEKEELEKQKEMLNKPGIHAKEINPYWKDGGTGLPQDEIETRARPSTAGNIGDAGLSWLKKSYERCVQQAKEEGRPLEELAAERWGSLETIQRQIKEAEDAKYGRNRSHDQNGSQRSRFMRPTDEDDQSHSSHRRRSRTPDRSSSRRRSRSRGRRSRSRSQDRRRSRSRDRRRSRSTDRQSRNRKYRSRSRDRSSRDRRSRSRDRERSHGGMSSLKGRFMRPGEMSEKDSMSRSNQRSDSERSRSDRVPAWKKKEFQKPVEEEKEERRQEKPESREPESRDRERGGHDRREKRRKQSSSSSSSSSSDSSESSSEDEARRLPKQEKITPVKILSEKEMNDLGAKILKAELMGNNDQAAKLKAQLEAAREAKKNAPAGSAQGQATSSKDDDDFVTLTRTDRSGMARPVPDAKYEMETGAKRRRKKQKVETHTGKQGERTKYFDDDDKFDLKTLVEREKMGTAEDQNQMFARLAGRAAERTDDDFQVDDVFLSKAQQKQSESIQEQRDRAAAIFEHRKMSTAMEKCQLCFNNVKKHLIIALGSKVYLCLPDHRSLTDGHCFIVPMQHSASSTAVDEDVWSEIQVFRKTLTRMFGAVDQDVVFMETSMRLKQFPHMCIEAVPMERETGDMAPIYFKKAIQECESEWSQNKKVVDLSQKDIRRAVPKGFPYFAVDFGNEGGFAHVIEDEVKFQPYFGRAIIGGMIDSDHRLWKRPPRENFEDQRKKVLQFAEMWKPYDWTQNIAKSVNKEDTSSSSSDSD